MRLGLQERSMLRWNKNSQLTETLHLSSQTPGPKHWDSEKDNIKHDVKTVSLTTDMLCPYSRVNLLNFPFKSEPQESYPQNDRY